MYDILQLNDMLVPELQDIATEQNIHNHKKLDKQELISKILDKQTVMNHVEKNGIEGDKPKRKRIAKPLTDTVNNANQQESAVEKPRAEARAKKPEPIVEKKKFVKKNIEKEEQDEQQEDEEEDFEKSLEASHNKMTAIAPALIELLNDDIHPGPEAQVNGGVPAQQKVFPQRRETSFNIEFDGVILDEVIFEEFKGTGMTNIRDVIPFPRTPKSADF